MTADGYLDAILASAFASDSLDRWFVQAGVRAFRDYDSLTVKERRTLAPLAADLTRRIRRSNNARDFTHWSRSIARFERGYLAPIPPDAVIELSCLAAIAHGARLSAKYDAKLDSMRLLSALGKRGLSFDPGTAVEHLLFWVEQSRLYDSLPPALTKQLRHRAGVVGDGPALAGDPLSGLRFRLDLASRLIPAKDWKEAIRIAPVRTAHSLARKAIELYESAAEVARSEMLDDLFDELAVSRPQALAGLHRRLAAFPSTCRIQRGSVYSGADAECRDFLIAQFETTKDLNGLLRALGRIGDARVAKAFREWDRRPGLWQGRVFVKPSAYAEEAGWTVTPGGKRRDLHLPTAVPLTRVSAETPRGGKRLTVGQRDEGACEQCRRPMRLLLDLDSRQPPFAGRKFRSRRFRILACAACFETRFTRWNADGTIRNGTAPESSESQWLGKASYRLGRPTNSANGWGSSLGGCPYWLQDSEFPDCPDCGERMLFLAQLDLCDLGGDGVVYGFACDGCRVTASGFQCT